ncbi:ketoacyl-ACP synthase III [Lactobacillus sp. LC28-10]|uniref:Beta-ketoacyl-[acyl-carrier-protein] synthase III n=1 Tax=Secundilactobacillus angelensis TaxID=2722706 RepID=A0ABX1L1A3_9LACO|nr:beta-ketoacyl-ACP synthase III [Secundilactobacillus angelensis]MCH5463277.1 ketoacyl-ACP synthase III [Secundilactobacillus angelensis]NLR19240.1 ketoacyl-ACP synthase III [Secundilactobacillus angelensis]
MTGIQIVQSANTVPERVVPNDELNTYMETSDEWISTRTGIKQRHVSTGQTTSDLCTSVAQKLLDQSGWQASDLDFIIVSTMSPDYLTPATAAIVQGRIGATNAFAFDLNAACSGFIYGLKVAEGLLQAPGSRGMLIGGEVLSKLVDWHERSTAVLFGDGAAGVLLENVKSTSSAFLATDLQTIGELGDRLTAGYQPVNSVFAMDSTDPHRQYFEMDGRAVYKFATHQVPESIERAVNQAGLLVDDIDYFILHQANQRILDQIAKRLDQPTDKFLSNVAAYGNTSAASVPILLDEAIQHGTLQRGQTIALGGFGGGLTVGTQIIKY